MNLILPQNLRMLLKVPEAKLRELLCHYCALMPVDLIHKHAKKWSEIKTLVD